MMHTTSRQRGAGWNCAHARGAVRLTVQEISVVVSELQQPARGFQVRCFAVRLAHILLLIIIPCLLGERVVPEAVHLDVAVSVELLIAKLLVAENRVQETVLVSETAPGVRPFVPLGLRGGGGRCAAGQPERRSRVADYHPLGGELLVDGAAGERAGFDQSGQSAVAVSGYCAHRTAGVRLPR